MFLIKLFAKILLFPVVLLILMLRLLVKLGMEVSSIILGALILIVFGCIIFALVHQTWNSMLILLIIEAFLVLMTAGTGVIEGILEIANKTLNEFMRA